jgi:hypothetical protein
MGGFSAGAKSGKSSLGQVSGTGTACTKLRGAGAEEAPSGCPSGWEMVASGPETGGAGGKLFPGGTAKGVNKNAGGTSIGVASGADGTGPDPGTGPASGALAEEKACASVESSSAIRLGEIAGRRRRRTGRSAPVATGVSISTGLERAGSTASGAGGVTGYNGG